MSDYITLLGAEQVQSAGQAMRSAGDEMRSAAGTIDQAVHQQRIAMDDHARSIERSARVMALAALIHSGRAIESDFGKLREESGL